jgi:hypothetical protein
MPPPSMFASRSSRRTRTRERGKTRWPRPTRNNRQRQSSFGGNAGSPFTFKSRSAARQARLLARAPPRGLGPFCQFALDQDPKSARKRDPVWDAAERIIDWSKTKNGRLHLSHSIISCHGNALIFQRKFFLRMTENRLHDPSKICALEFEGEFRRFGIWSVSATIDIDWPIFPLIAPADR